MRINDLSRASMPRSPEYQEKMLVESNRASGAVTEPNPAQNAVEAPTHGEEDTTVNDEIIKRSIEQANKSLKMHNRMIERTVHEVTHTIMYKLKDTVTNEVIQEFPPKKIQDMIAKMWELAGLFIDEKA